jgi:RimJ/RimL family protein N-acetyltransferase
VGQFRGVELDDVELDGPRLHLRPWRLADTDRLVAVMAEPSMHEYVALPNPYTLEDASWFVTELARRPRAEGTGLTGAWVERSTGRVVAAAGLRFDGDPEIGYWVAPDARGAGYAAEVTTTLADWAFRLGLRRVRLACDVRNLASARTALAAGFRFEGVARDAMTSPGGGAVPPRFGDLARFARLAGDPAGRIPYAFPPLGADGLSDGVLQLRTTRPDDAPGLAETDDPVTLRWGFTSAAHSAQEVRRAADQAGLDWLVGGVAAFAMIDVATGRFAGALRLRKQGPPQVGGIGYVVHPDFRGRGYTTRALRLLVPWAFEVADFARLELGAKVGNEPSLRAAAKAGFEPDGIRKGRLRNPDGTFADEQRYALINPKYV